ncbi:unnamed protein product [Clonostachys rhizophaga]|uniref:Uncharacterized protein n=1 Tax=Clonostachys rhizophaga TaxID=160324 RepID=A0A9N9VHS8_9HYPO|nr:unnamed protein product [Clonostachys rhizophaga]
MISPMSLIGRHFAALLLATSSIFDLTEAATKIKGGADPAIMKSGDYYYSANTCGSNNICVRKAKTLVGLGDGAESKTVWSDTDGKGEVWAPEIAIEDGKTYIYFAAGKSSNHRMYVISADSPQGTYSKEAKKINLPDDQPAIDGLYFKFEGKRWFVWSGWTPGNSEQTIYICAMKSPTEATGKKYVISQPREAWEKKAGLINEGPEVIVDPNGQLHIVYSANGSWASKYCLADLRLKKGGNPTYVWDWYKSNGCLFGSHQDNMMKGWDATVQIDGPGHHTFALADGDTTKSPGGSSKIPFVFHGVPKGTEYKWGNRNWYTGSFVWWSKTTYSRANVPGDNKDTGYSFKFFE